MNRHAYPSSNRKDTTMPDALVSPTLTATVLPTARVILTSLVADSTPALTRTVSPATVTFTGSLPGVPTVTEMRVIVAAASTLTGGEVTACSGACHTVKSR